MNLPMPEYGKTDKETIGILMDTVVKLRKELEYVLYHLDEQNIPMMKSVVGDIKGAYTAIEQNEQQISLLATDLSGAKAQITVQAGQISSLVSTTQGQQSQITQNANSITTLVSTTQGQQTQINQNAQSITLLSTTVDGHTAQISVQAGQISQKVGYNGVISAINQTAETIEIDAQRIDMYGITRVNNTLQIGYLNEDAKLIFRNNTSTGYVEIFNGYGFNAENLYVDCGQFVVQGSADVYQSLSVGGGLQVSNNTLSVVNPNGQAMVAYGDIDIWQGYLRVSGNDVSLDGHSHGEYVENGGGQNLKLQIYGGSLEVYKDGSYFGTIAFS